MIAHDLPGGRRQSPTSGSHRVESKPGPRFDSIRLPEVSGDRHPYPTGSLRFFAIFAWGAYRVP